MKHPKTRHLPKHEQPALPFDVTQEIDPALAEMLRRTAEPTLNPIDFDDITIVLPEPPTKR